MAMNAIIDFELKFNTNPTLTVFGIISWVYMYVKLDRQDRPESVVTWSDVDSIGDEVIHQFTFPALNLGKMSFLIYTARSTTQKKNAKHNNFFVLLKSKLL